MSLKNFLEKVSKMPEFPHSVEGQPYDVNNSQAVLWMIEQPEVREYLMEKARGYQAIEFDPVSKKWRGTGKSTGNTFTEKEVIEALAQSFKKSEELLALCEEKYGRECGMWTWKVLVKKMTNKGLLAYDKRDGYAVAR
jgi:hypothetical protein